MTNATKYHRPNFNMFLTLPVVISAFRDVLEVDTAADVGKKVVVLVERISVVNMQLYTVCLRKTDTALACYNFHVHQPILIIFSRNVAKEASSQMALYFSTSPN